MEQKALLATFFRRLEGIEAKFDRFADEVRQELRDSREERGEQLQVLKEHTQRSTRNEEELRVVRDEFKVLAGETSRIQLDRQFWAGVGKTLSWITAPSAIAAGVALWKALHAG